MDVLLDPQVLVGLATLIVLEIVLGIDNLIFIAILADRLPPELRERARVIGLSLALVMRMGLLTGISWLVSLTAPLVTLSEDIAFSGRDLILLVGGFFLLFKATVEIHDRLEGPEEGERRVAGHASFWSVIAQIVVLDAVFSLDSVITAVGMVNELWVMMTAVGIAMGVMIVASSPLTRFVNAHPTVVMLCLGFLLMIGLSLIAEGFGFDIPKGYLYAAIGFSILVETFNQLSARNQHARELRQPLRQRTATSVLRLLGSRLETDGGAQPAYADTERRMVAGVMRLGERSVRSIMTPRHQIAWLDAAASQESWRRALAEHGHSRYLVGDGSLDALLGVVVTRELLPALMAGGPSTLRGHIHEALVVHDRLSVVLLIDQLKTTPTRLAVVVDDHGSIDGLVTPTDVLSAIAGDLVEAEDGIAPPLRHGDGSLEFDAMTPALEAAEALGLYDLAPDESHATLAGFLLRRFGRVPSVGDSVEWEGLQFTVTAMDGRRIARAAASPRLEPV